MLKIAYNNKVKLLCMRCDKIIFNDSTEKKDLFETEIKIEQSGKSADQVLKMRSKKK